MIKSATPGQVRKVPEPRRDRPFTMPTRGVQVAVLLGSYFGTHLVLKVSNFPEKIVSEGHEHRPARQNVIFFISESRNYHVGTKIGPQK